MEIVTTLSAISTALTIAKDLRDLDQSLGDAESKAKLAELYSTLADAKVALSDVKLELQEKNEIISDLKRQLTALKSGEVCPICRTGVLKTLSIKNDGIFGALGGKRHNMACDNPSCDHIEDKLVTPE